MSTPPSERTPAATAAKPRFQEHVYAVMDRLIAAKAAERVDPADVAARRSAPKGSLTAARAWLNGEFFRLLWEAVGRDLNLTIEELEGEWKGRADRELRTAHYASGTFVLIKRPAMAGLSEDYESRAAAQAVPRRRTEDEWWNDAPDDERARWLAACFVETSGLFEIVRTSNDELCVLCRGSGVHGAAPHAGSQATCVECNGIGRRRTVEYR